MNTINILIGFLVAAFIAFAAMVHMNITSNKEVLSDFFLTNVEALASSEVISTNGPYQTMSYCGGSKIKLTCTFEYKANSCTREEC